MPSSRTARLVLFAAFLLAPLLLRPHSASADVDMNAQLGQPTDAEAREHLKQGNAFYKIGEFDKAIEEYKAGSLAESAGVFQFNIAQSYRQQGNYDKAIWHYERFIAMRQPTGELKEMIEGFIVMMKAELEKAASRQEPTGPGPVETATDVGQGEQPAEVHRQSWATGRRKVAIGVAAAGLIAIGAGVAFGVRAKGFEDDAESLCPQVECAGADESNRLLARGQDNALYANLSIGVGAAAIAGAAVLWFTGAPPRPASSHAIRPVLTPSYVGVALGARF